MRAEVLSALKRGLTRRAAGIVSGALAAFSLAAVTLPTASCGRATPAVQNPFDAAGLPTAEAASNYGGAWLWVQGNHLKHADGSNFHGRGADLQDTRGCDACTHNAPNPAEVIRRADTLIDDWHATFVRLLLESYGTQNGRTQWQTVLDDPGYLADVQTIVQHFADRKTYVLLSLWLDPTFTALGLPTDRTNEEWVKLATAFKDNPYVIYGLVNEPAQNFDGAQDAEVWTALNSATQAIRDTEPANGPHHIISVQGSGGYARRLGYYLTHPIAAGGGIDIVYEEHFYNPIAMFDAQVLEPAKTLPVIIAEFGPVTNIATMTIEDCAAMMTQAEAAEIPWMAYSFHFRCPPNLLVDNSNHSCGVGSKLAATDPFGTLIKSQLAKPF